MIRPLVPRWCRVVVCALAVVACPRPAAAEWQFAPFFGWEFGGHTSLLDLEAATDKTHRAFGGTVTFLRRGPLGFEAIAVYVPGYFNDPKRSGQIDLTSASRTYALMGNVVFAAPQGWNEYGLRPYASGGVGLMNAKEDLLDPAGSVLLQVNQNLFGLNVGGGAVGFLSDHTGLRFDLRFFTNVRNFTNDEAQTVNTERTHLRYWVASVGLVLR
ncbi:MAG TPA: hypothetical protein VF147_19065 [Vicinamibacterales bacterium]